MESTFLNNPAFWAIMLQIVTIVALAIIKFNDLNHLEGNFQAFKKETTAQLAILKTDSDLKHNENKDTIKDMLEEIKFLRITQAEQQAICKERHEN